MDRGEEITRKFWKDRAGRPDFLWRDLAELNFKLLKPYLKSSMTVLDLGAGDGRLTKMVADWVYKVTAVDYTEAVKRISHARISTAVADIREYSDPRQYDLVLLFGVMNFIQDPEEFYRPVRPLVRDGGALVVKHQCGRRGTVDVETAIDGVPYISCYRHIGDEVSALIGAGFGKVEVSTPYPDSMNPWKNTVHTAFVATL